MRRSKQSSEAKVFRTRWASKLWICCEIFLVAIAMGTPYWVSSDRVASRLATATFGEGPRLTTSTITSRIVQLPDPSTLGQKAAMAPLQFSIETKQFRFEKQNFRKLASVDETQSWKLKTILRQIPTGDWEDVTLVNDEAESPVASVFVELSEGENKFVVTFEGQGGVHTSYPVKIDFVRSDKT